MSDRRYTEAGLRDAYCWGHMDESAKRWWKRTSQDERQADAEAAWEHDRHHLTHLLGRAPRETPA